MKSRPAVVLERARRGRAEVLTERAAELHAKADRAEGEAGEQARRALRDHYADRFRPETSRMELLDQAAAYYAAR